MTPSRQPPARVPTLTEVVDVPVLALDLDDGSGDAGAAIVQAVPPASAPIAGHGVAPSVSSAASAAQAEPEAHAPAVPAPGAAAPATSAGPPPAPLPPPRVSDLLVAGLRDEALLPVGEVLVPRPRPAAPAGPTAPAPVAPSLEDQVTQRVLADLQRQVDLMLEYRLREVLAPALARVSDLLVRETRHELASTLRDIVGRAVAQELARRRTGR